MKYEINRFVSAELPDYKAGWQDICDRCVYKRENKSGNKFAPKLIRCTAIKAKKGGYVACSEARITDCDRGQLFVARVL